MKPVIKRRPVNRLSKLFKLPGGRTIGTIETDVEARLEALKDVCILAVQAKVQEIGRLAAEMSRPPTDEQLGLLHFRSNEVLGLAGVADLEDAGRAAMSFCRLLDAWRSGKTWSAAPFDVHLAALQLLVQPESDLDETARDHMIQGLNAVVRRALG